MRFKAASIVRELGWPTAVLYALDRAFDRIGVYIRVNPCVLVAQPVLNSRLLPERRSKSIAVRQIPADDPLLQGLPLSPETLAHRTDAGIVCIAAFKESELVGCQWLTLGGHEDEQFRVRLVPQPEASSVWDFDIYLDPTQRSTFVFARLWDATFEFLTKRGVRWSMSYISTFNPGSLASHRRLGALPVGRALFVRLGPWQLILTSLRPFILISSGPNSRPTLRVPAPKTRPGGD